MEPIEAASKIISDLSIKHPSEIKTELIAQHYGATVNYANMNAAAGRLVRLGDRAIITIPLNTNYDGRRRFSIGHELGHLILHQGLSGLFSCSSQDMMDWRGYKAHETQANQFSAELLMPYELFYPKIVRKIPNIQLVKLLAEEFRTSLTATAVRYIHVTKEPCALIYCVDSQIQWFMKNRDEFNYMIKDHKSLVDPDSMAYEAFVGNGDFPSGQSVPAEVWIKADRLYNRDLELIESTCYLESFNATLSLLWEK